MQKVGFRGKKWDQSQFSGVVRTILTLASVIFFELWLVILHLSNFIWENDEAP